MHRLSVQRRDEWLPAVGTDTFTLEAAGLSKRLVVSPISGPMDLLLKLAPEAGSEFYVLWVLHTPRGGSRAGRYQSRLVQLAEVRDLFARFGAFLEHDGRHDIWLHAPQTGATLVWDRHEQLFLYGPLDRFEAALEREGLARGSASVSLPHSHNYHPEFDEAERAMATAIEWRIGDLREEDEQ